MAVTITGSPIEIQTAANASSQSVTVPADADLVVIGVSGYESGSPFTNGSLTLNSVALTKNIADDDSAFQGGQFYLVNPATGSQTLAWDWGGTAALFGGVILVLRFYKGVDTADPIRDSHASQAAAGVFATDTLTAQTDDLVTAFSWMFGGSPEPVTWTNATEIDEYGAFTFANASLAEVAPSGNVQITATWDTASDGGIAALVLQPAAGSASPTVNPTGQAITLAQGTPTVSLVTNPTVLPSGLALSLTQGTIAVSIDGEDTTVNPTGQSITFTQGTFNIRADVSWGPEGQSLSIAQGTPTAGVTDATPEITGQSITLAQGTPVIVVSGLTVFPVGQRITIRQGRVFNSLNVRAQRGRRLTGLR